MWHSSLHIKAFLVSNIFFLHAKQPIRFKVIRATQRTNSNQISHCGENEVQVSR